MNHLTPPIPSKWTASRRVPHVRRRELSEKTYQLECTHCRATQTTDRESVVHTLWRLDFLNEHRFCEPRRY
jgi:hypothetical protein